MRTFTHDYTKAAEAERLVFEAYQALTGGKAEEAERLIVEADTALREYLAKDNVVEDPEAEGYIRAADTFDEGQIDYIRDIFGEILEKHGDKYEELGIVNTCQRLMGDPEFESLEQFKRNTSGVWTEITEGEEEEE